MGEYQRDLLPALGTALIRSWMLQGGETPPKEDHSVLHAQVFHHRQLSPIELPKALDILGEHGLNITIGYP